MAIWYLIMWNLLVPPFEGGQYQTHESCLRHARAQYAYLSHLYGPLYWKCELRIVL